MRILYVAPKYDYGKIERGYGFEHYNFYEFFRRSGHAITYFDSVSSFEDLGREGADRHLLELVKSEHPNLMFSVLFKDELNPAVVRDISENTETVTLNWFCDDHWRFESFTRHWAPCFNWVVTTAQSALPKYEQIGYRNAIKSQWACNHTLYRKLDLRFHYDVSFVGQPHGDRRRLIGDLHDAGVEVHLFGAGWEAGRVTQDEMIRIFNQSRINLNLSNASTTPAAEVGAPAAGAPAWMLRTLARVPFGASIRQHGRTFVDRARGLREGAPKGAEYVQQIKARNFEVPGCGGFLLTGDAEDLGKYYAAGTEIVCFDGRGDLVEKIKYYLAHEEERAAIARAGYERTLRDHTYANRFREIFSRLGLTHD